MNFEYASLIQSLRQGTALTFQDLGSGYQLGIGRWSGSPKYRPIPAEVRAWAWERPHYEFGHIFDRGHADWLGQTIYDDLLTQGLARVASGTFVLPHPLCAYQMQCDEDDADWDRAYWSVLEQDAASTSGVVFLRQNAPAGNPLREWVMDCATFHLEADGSETYEFSVSYPSPAQAGALHARTQLTLHDVVVATMLLSQPAHAVDVRLERSFRLDRFNSKRKRGTPRLEAPRIVNINRTLLLPQSSTGSPTSGTQKAPHERRGHTRVLRRGTEWEREVPVKASSINGGKPMQPCKVVA